MDFLDLVTEVIDLRSFSNLWYWIVLAILWSALSQRVIGVPYYVVLRARRGDPTSVEDMHTLARLTVRRMLAVTDVSGPYMVAVASFILTGLAVTGWAYRVEFCQALFLLFLPLVCVSALSVVTARKLRARDFAELDRALRLHRMIVQGLGVLFIFLTAFWGMYVNVTVGPLG